MPSRKQSDQWAGVDEGARLTPEQAGKTVEGWTMTLFNDNESIGDLLLLLHSLYYERDMTEREQILQSIERVLLPFAPAVGDAVRNLM